MHTTASRLVAIAQFFDESAHLCISSVIIITPFNYSLLTACASNDIEAVNDYPPIRFEIRFERKFPIRRSLV